MKVLFLNPPFFPIAEDALNAMGATEAHAAMTEAKCELIRSVRALRASYNIPTGKPLDIVIAPASGDAAEFLRRDKTALQAFLAAGTLDIVDAYKQEGPCGTAVSTMATCYVPLKGIVDLEAELKKLQKQEEELLKYIETVQKKLSNANFVARAPKDVVDKEKAKIAESEEKLARVRAQMEAYK